MVTFAEPVALYPALLLIGGAGIVLVLLLLLARRGSSAPTSVVAPPDTPPPDPQPALDDAVMRFTRDVTRPASFEELQLLIARQLPMLLGVERAWVVARLGGRQRVILPEAAHAMQAARGAPDAPEKRDPLFDGERTDWTTFPLHAEGRLVGVLGVEVTGRKLADSAVAIVRAVAPIIAHALLTADTTDRLRETSILDPLTGCATRLHGQERLAIELKRAARSGASLAVVMVDLDHFKDVNDRFGHNVGDAVLTAVGRIMLQTLRASDVRCRWGGEEFLIVLPETTLEPARQVAESLLRRLADSPVHTRAGIIRMSASIGLTLARPGEDDIEALIGRADRALYRAKSDGRGCVRIVLGDLKGAPIGGAAPPAPLPFRDRRDPNRPDRRRVPGGGRRKTDAPYMPPSAEDAPFRRRAGDRANAS